MRPASTASAKPKRLSTKPRGDRINLTETKDGPLLKLIRNSTFIAHSQLVALALKLNIATSRETVKWRVQRYVRIGMVEQLPRVYPYRGAVYTITKPGLSVLECYGEGLASITSESRHLADPIQAEHCLEINELRLAVQLTGTITVDAWYTDREVSSMNYTASTPFAKDYDAILQIGGGNQKPIRFGLEYERTYKSLDRYTEIARIIAQERQLNFILYVTSSEDMVFKLAPLLAYGPVPVCVTSANVFRQQTFSSMVAFQRQKNIVLRTLQEFIAAVGRSA